ncbi:MAG: hypothetical protein ACP5F1_06530 [Thermoplasmata archaeon]|nr:hypothetical protein [Thermoplasmata archaeon]
MDSINEVSNILQEEFWVKFVENLSPKEKRILIIFNCDEYEKECHSLLGISDYLIRVGFKENKIEYFISKLKL